MSSLEFDIRFVFESIFCDLIQSRYTSVSVFWRLGSPRASKSRSIASRIRMREPENLWKKGRTKDWTKLVMTNPHENYPAAMRINPLLEINNHVSFIKTQFTIENPAFKYHCNGS